MAEDPRDNYRYSGPAANGFLPLIKAEEKRSKWQIRAIADAVKKGVITNEKAMEDLGALLPNLLDMTNDKALTAGMRNAATKTLLQALQVIGSIEAKDEEAGQSVSPINVTFNFASLQATPAPQTQLEGPRELLSEPGPETPD